MKAYIYKRYVLCECLKMNWLDQRSYDKAIISEGFESINQRQHHEVGIHIFTLTEILYRFRQNNVLLLYKEH